MTAKEETEILKGQVYALQVLNGMAIFLLTRTLKPDLNEAFMGIFDSVVLPHLKDVGSMKGEPFRTGAGAAVDSFKAIVLDEVIEPDPVRPGLIGKAMGEGS